MGGNRVCPIGRGRAEFGEAPSQVSGRLQESKLAGRRRLGNGWPNGDRSQTASSVQNTGWPSGQGGGSGNSRVFVHSTRNR